MKKNLELAFAIALVALLASYTVFAVIYPYVWYSQSYHVSGTGLSSMSEITGDLIIDHTQTVKANITNGRSTPAVGNVTVNIVYAANHSLVANIYPETTVTIPTSSTWTLTDTWTPTSEEDYQVEVLFNEEG